MTRVPGQGTSRLPAPGTGRTRIPASSASSTASTSRLRPPGIIPPGTRGSRILASNAPSTASTSRLRPPGIIPPGTVRTRSPASSTASTSRLRPPAKAGLKFESKLKKFDRNVNEELKRRRDISNVLVTAATSDPSLREAVDHLARAEAAHVWSGAVHAAEQAAATTEDSRQAEEAAAEGARNFQTEIIETIQENIPGLKPVQVIGYIGLTRPKRAAR